MNALEFFQLRRDGLCQAGNDLLEAPEAIVRARPHRLNSIAWLVWHISRCEDVGVNRIVGYRPQVLDDEVSRGDLGVSRRDIGTSMTDQEVTDLSEHIDLAALCSYWRAVTKRTAEVIGDLDPQQLDAVVGPAFVHRLISEEGVFGAAALSEGFEAFWARQPNRGWFLAQLALTHSWGHIFDARITRSLLQT